MTKKSLKNKFEDVEVSRILYLPGSKQDLEECFRDVDETEKGFREKRYSPIEGRPESILQQYGPSDLTVIYLCDNFISWEGGQIVNTSVSSGAQAQRFLEYCLNNLGKLSNTPLQVKAPFSQIPFQATESNDKGERILRVVTGANHPNLLWREMWNIFVKEKGRR